MSSNDEINSITGHSSENTNKSESDQNSRIFKILCFLDAENKLEHWNYTMRRSMQEVVPNVFLGPYSAASSSKLQYLLNHKITHIICIRHVMEANVIKPNFPDRFKYLVLNIADTNTENIIQHFEKVKAFIDEGLNSDGRVLIHGNAGISRSAAVALAYVMETYELTQERAYLYVHQRRSCINPNRGFLTQLKEYEPIYQARKTLTNGQQSSANQRNKRKADEFDKDSLEYKSKKDS